ncbi:glutamate ligase domain-containing protein [Streptomyces sp. NPDC002851]
MPNSQTSDPDTATPVIHPVPYYAQWASPELVPAIIRGEIPAAEDPLWHTYGADSPETYEWWSWRLCGIACLRMALHHWHGNRDEYTAPTAMTLAEECLKAGAYVKRDDGGLDGLIYSPFAAYLRERWDIHAEARPDLPATEIPEHLATGHLVILSVHPSIRTLDPEPPRQGGHLVLAVGATQEHVVIHNPSGFPGTSQQFHEVPWPDLDRFYAGRGVILGPPEETRRREGGRTIAVLGEMLELGNEAVETHRNIGRFAAETGVDLLVAVGGDLAKQLALAAADAGVPEVAIVADNQTAATFVHSHLRPGDVVLTKASRDGQLWQVAQALTGQPITGLEGH